MYNVTYRTVNLRFKISHAKRNRRVMTFWVNCIRMNVLHQLLFGAGKLRYIGYDQKPFYFNSSLAQKTLAMKGSDKVPIKENVAASRERFTGMTTCPSWKLEPGDGVRATADGVSGIAVLFRVATGENCTHRVRGKCLGSENMLVQFAPKGSYRVEHVLRYLDWSLNPVATAAETIMVVLDWFSAHLDGRVDDAVHDKTIPYSEFQAESRQTCRFQTRIAMDP